MRRTAPGWLDAQLSVRRGIVEQVVGDVKTEGRREARLCPVLATGSEFSHLPARGLALGQLSATPLINLWAGCD